MGPRRPGDDLRSNGSNVNRARFGINREPAESPEHEEFLRLFSSHQLRVYRYIVTLVPNQADAEEIFGETNLIIWRKSDSFSLGTNFMAWACRIAYLEVLKYRQRKSRQPFGLGGEVVELLASEAVEKSDLLERRHRALAGCLEKLSPKDSELINACYRHKADSQSIAKPLGRSASSVRHSFSRIRRALKRCIDAALATEEHA